MKKKFTILITAAVMLLTMMVTTGTMWGQTREDLVLTFSLTSNPGGWPTANSTTLTNYTYTLNTVEYTFALMNVKCNSGYLMLTQPAVLGVPAIEGYKLTKIVASNSSGCSTSTKVGISSSASSPSYIGGGEIQTWSTQSSSYTYTLTSTAANTMYYIYVTNKNAQIISLALTYAPGGGGSDPTIILSESGTLNIGNYAVNTELDSRTFTVSQSNLSEGITLTATNGGTLTPNSIDLDADPTEVTWNFTTPAEAGQFTSVITATSGETSASFTYLGYAYANHNVIIAEMEHGTVIADPTSTYYYQNVTLTVTPDEGYELGTLSVMDGNNDPVTVTNNSFKMPDSDVTVSATFVVATPTTTVTDELNYDFTGISGSGYKSWEGKEGESGAIYAGNSNAGVTYIQLRTNNNNSGIVTTTSGGKVSKVTVEWAEGNTSGRSLDVYGKNSDYSSASDLYNNSNQGTKLGSIVYGTNTELTISGNYSYIGLRSANNAIYLNEIDIDWEVNGTPTPSISASNVEIAFDATGGNIAYTINNEPNPAGTLTAAIKTGTTPTITDFAIGTVTSSTVPFTCSANTTSSAHTATVTLTYTYGDNQTTTKDVVVTQAGNPDAFDNISSINASGSFYKVRGTVVAKSAYAFVLGDGTGYIYYYNGYSAPAVSIGEKKIVQGTTGNYGHVIQFTNAATISVSETSGYDGTPAVSVITEVPDYSEGLHLSTYLQFEGELTKTGNYYYVAVGESRINIAYPSTGTGGQTAALDALLNKNVRVKGYFSGISTSANAFSVLMDSVEEIVNPSISINPAAANPFTYVFDDGPSAEQVFEVTGTNLTSTDIVATITTGANYFEITDDAEYSSEVTVNSGDYISIRLKAGLELGSDYAGVLTLTSTGADDVVVNLTGSVTGATYAISLDDEITGGTIEADKASAAEGETVTLTATPDAAYTFGSWTVYKDDMSTEVTVTDNQFTMPACEVYVTATFNAKPTHAITRVVTPEGAALMEASPESAYEGQTVTLSYAAETGYSLSSIVITKTSDGSATSITPTASGDDYTFTMPGYAVTATATFLSDTYTGSFVLFENAIEEGDYLIVLNDKAVLNTISSARLNSSDVAVSNGIISDPSRNIVWHIAPSATDGYWAIYNAKIGQYISNSKASDKDIALVNTTNYNSGAIWSIDGTTTYVFRSKYNQDSGNSARYLGQNGDYFASYTSSYDHNLTLYKYTELTKRTITFNGNGGTTPTGETYTQTVYDGIATNLTANQFTKENSAFIGWSTTQNGDVEYADGASITVSGDITLYAQWSTAYTAMVDDAIVGGTVLINGDAIVEVAAGTVMTLTYNATPGYVFSAWNVYKADNPTEAVEVENNQFNMPEYDVIVSAKFDEVTTYLLVTNVNQIVSGKHYIIATGSINNKYYAIGGQNSSGYRNPVEVTVDNNYIAHTDGLYEFVLNVDNESGWTIYDKVTPGYFVSGNKSLTTNANNGTAFNISINDENDPKATISKNGYSIQYNSSSPRFACYSSSQKDVYLYIKLNDNDLEYYGSEITYTENTIPTGETITVGTGSVMTINNGSFTNTDPEKLIIEDGGQLIHDNAVSATIQKNVTGYSNSKDKDNNGYLLIASPVESDLNVATQTNLTEGDYDLYYFDHSYEHKEWRNFKKTDNPELFTSIKNGIGYLYANTQDITISFSGELKPSLNVVQVDLAYVDGKPFSGWNLVGNPFACNAYIIGATEKVEAYYKMNDNGNGFVASTDAIDPMEGIFVQANAIDQYFYFTRTAPDATPGKGNLNIQVAQVVNSRDAQPTIDNAIVRFDGGNTLEKFSFSEDNAKLYIPQNGKDYAVVNADTQGEMPVNFKAAENGTYTIDFSMDNVEFGYLHLIDNKTGNDVDLLQTPSYTFEANTIDYASRFRLVFSAIGNENDSENNDFGFFDANGNLLILGIEGTATLCVMDVTGRVISNETFSGNYSKAINAKAGVYMLRLIQGNDVRTQKIVVR